MMVVMHFMARVHIAFCADALAKQNVDRQSAHRGFDDLDAVAALGFELFGECIGRLGTQKIGFVYDNHISAGDLILEQLGQGCFVIKVFVQFALGIDGRNIMGKATLGHGLAINNSHNAIDGDLRGNLWPVECADQGLRQRKTRGFDNDVIRLFLAREQFFHRGDEIISNSAADAAVGQLHDVVLCAGFITAAFEDITINAKVAEFVDDERDALALSIFKHVTDQRGLARAKKTSDDSGRNFSRHKRAPFGRQCARYDPRYHLRHMCRCGGECARGGVCASVAFARWRRRAC